MEITNWIFYNFSQAVVFNDIVFLSGVLGINKDTNKLVDGGAGAQAKKALENIGAILQASGSSYENVLKNTILMKDMKDYGVVNEVYRQCKCMIFFEVGKVRITVNFL